MTSNHPWLADVFYSAGVILAAAKFLTWEETKQLDRSKRNKSYGLAVGLALVLVCALIWGDHRLSASRQTASGVVQSPSLEHPAEKKPEDIPKAEAQQKRPAQVAEPSIPSSKSNPKSKGQAKQQPAETVTGPIDMRQQSSGANSPNIAQVGNNNQVIVNPEPPEKNWVITEDI